MSTHSTEQHVLIIGAGLTGLSVAHGLHKAGIRYSIFETEDANAQRRREWTMGIHWAVNQLYSLLPPPLASRLVSEATVDPSLDYVTPPTNGSKIFDGATGELLKELKADEMLLRVSRRKLRKLISEGVDVKFGHTLQDVGYHDDGTVTALFSNGAKHTGTIVLGCDGPRSVVRNLLFGAEKGKALPVEGIVQVSTTLCYKDAAKARQIRSAHPVWYMVLHPDIYTYHCIQDVPDPSDASTWKHFIFLNWMGEKDETLTNEQRIRLVKEKAAKGNLQEPFRSVIEGIPEDEPLPYVETSYWIAEPWDTHEGRLTMAGDAAHPMPPYRGQGLNHAIQDAYNFVQLLSKFKDESPKKRAQAVKEYSDEVASRGAEETKLSLKNGYMLTSYYDFKESPYYKQGLSKQQQQ